MKYYVTMTWDDFPEGGSYGNVVEADNADEAERLIKMEMAVCRAEERASDPEEDHYDTGDMVADILSGYEGDWHVVDCQPVPGMIASLVNALAE